MKGHLMMSKKERLRKVFVTKMDRKEISLREAAAACGITTRQMRRAYRRYVSEGDAGLVHAGRGKTGKSKYTDEYKQAVLNAYTNNYQGFGPTLASEKITKKGYPCGRETLRLWLKKAGLWEQRRKGPRYRKARPRKEHFGELLQIDGSFHRWFGPENPSSCLMNFIDDATGTTLSYMSSKETTESALALLHLWIKTYGVPRAIYADQHATYFTRRKDGEEETLSQFGRICKELGIEIIRAYSPQAKGRVERNHAVYQDRFVKELALCKITSLKAANILLQESFIPDINARFARKPAGDDVHRKASDYGDLEAILCWEDSRKVANDWTFSYKNKTYQIAPESSTVVRPGHKVIVREHINRRISVWFNNACVSVELVGKQVPREKPPVITKPSYDSTERSEISRRNKHKSPWSLPGQLFASSRSSTTKLATFFFCLFADIFNLV